MTPTDQKRLATLDARFQPLVAEVLRRAPERGIHPFISQARRSRELQACFYARGRVTPGETAILGGLHVTTSLRGDQVVARCGAEAYTVRAADWRAKVTQVLTSWHIEGFAVDFSFYPSAEERTDLIVALEARAKLAKVKGDTAEARRCQREAALLYAKLNAIWRDVAPDTRWGNDWDQDGIPVDEDPDESFADMPHFEWHPGKTLEQVRAGQLPPFLPQCPDCRNFRAIMIHRAGVQRCRDCDGKRGTS